VLFALSVATSAAAQSCEGLSHTFSSGATWRVCAGVSAEHGITLSNLHYFAPGDTDRQVLQALHPAQIQWLQNSTGATRFLLGKSSQHKIVALTDKTCDGTLHSVGNTPSLCTVVSPLPLLAKYGTRRALHGEAFDVFAVSAHDSLNWRSNITLTEDGRIIPSITLSGLRMAEGTADGSATIQTSWRMAFAINGDGSNDRVEQYDFPLDRQAGNKRAMEIKPISTESFANVSRDNFRGWRVLDETGAGYYLDPQNSGYQMVSNTSNWAKFHLAVTAYKPCEQLANDNNTNNCGNNLDSFLTGEALQNKAPVLWYSQSRIYRPRTEDTPVISSLTMSFDLLPFEWTANSPFEALD